MWFPKASLACDILRNCYEAFALYSFGSYLIACLGGESGVIELLENKSRKQLGTPLLEEEDENRTVQDRSFSNFFFQPCTLGKDLLAIEKFGLVQYMILKTVCAFLALLLELFGVYGDGEFKWNYGYPYMAAVLNFSQMWALYCLVKFYNLQGYCVCYLVARCGHCTIAYNWSSAKGGKATNWTAGFLDLYRTLIIHVFLSLSRQMAIAAVAHVYVFPVEPYRFLPVSEYGKVITETTKEALKLEEGDKEKSAALEKKETKVEATGTSVTESVQDIVVEGGQHVVQDVVLTINQAIGPVEKGVTKIQETFYHKSEAEDSDDQEERVELKVEQHVEEDHSESETHVNSGRDLDTK
ncbi:hypothetical protein CMV_024869 [Castanea mollissima]|uniref:Uncharacterized protein n=1 Tax=Castanea mollissima TaxID=60419 RepID=A0A8J4V968_9ROSI|nr:hypothetical protein CMV_024869 [Castanea mollissima]